MNKESNKIFDFLISDYIYLPYYKDYKINVKDGEYIYKNELLINNDKQNIYSSVSGKILGLTTLNNKKYIVIENDFKDKLKIRKGVKRYINKYTKDELTALLKKYNIISEEDVNSKVLIISGIAEYFEENVYSTLLVNYTRELLDTIDALIEVMNIRKCFLAISNSDQDCVNILLNNLGTYPKIDLKLFNYDFSIGNKYVLINKLTNYRHKNYGILYFNIKELMDIYTVLKKDISPSYVYLNLMGDLINFNRVIRVKKGTNIDDLLNEYKITNKDSVYINGLLNGIKLNNTNYIIDNDIRSIFISKDIFTQEQTCINCGLCYKNCPININPKYMHFNNDEKSKKYREKCIGCGICSYVCPAKINLRGVYKDDKK